MHERSDIVFGHDDVLYNCGLIYLSFDHERAELGPQLLVGKLSGSLGITNLHICKPLSFHPAVQPPDIHPPQKLSIAKIIRASLKFTTHWSK